MTLCVLCHKDRRVGDVVDDDFVCGYCNPSASVGNRRDFGRGIGRGR